jgi:hypothetical protein
MCVLCVPKSSSLWCQPFLQQSQGFPVLSYICDIWRLWQVKLCWITARLGNLSVLLFYLWIMTVLFLSEFTHLANIPVSLSDILLLPLIPATFLCKAV